MRKSSVAANPVTGPPPLPTAFVPVHESRYTLSKPRPDAKSGCPGREVSLQQST